MKVFYLSVLFAGLSGFGLAQDSSAEFGSGGGEEKIEEGLQALKPRELLPLLPVAPEGWKLTLSKASDKFGQWYSCLAERVYEGPPSQEGSPPARVSIRLLDTAGEGFERKAFDDFEEGENEGGVRALRIDGMPAFQQESGPVESLRVLIHDRFLLTLLQRHSRISTGKWLELIALDEIAKLADQSRTVKRRDVVLIREINELDPSRNSRYLVSLTRALTEDEKRELKALLEEDSGAENR